MENENIESKTLSEFLEESKELNGEGLIYVIDKDLANSFGLETVRGTPEQLLIILQALRIAVMAADSGLYNADDYDELDDDSQSTAQA